MKESRERKPKYPFDTKWNKGASHLIATRVRKYKGSSRNDVIKLNKKGLSFKFTKCYGGSKEEKSGEE